MGLDTRLKNVYSIDLACETGVSPIPTCPTQMQCITFCLGKFGPTNFSYRLVVGLHPIIVQHANHALSQRRVGKGRGCKFVHVRKDRLKCSRIEEV